MDEQDRAVDDAVRRLLRVPEPSADDKQHTLARLSLAIEQEARPTSRRSWRLVPLAVGALALSVVSFLVVDMLRTTPVQAAFEEIAEAAEQADPHQLTDTEYFYLKSEELALGVVPAEMLTGVDFAKPELVYQLTSVREVWYGNRGAVQIRTTSTGVDFFSPQDRDAYFQAGLDESLDRLGHPVTITVTEEQPPNWPNTPSELDAAITEAAQGDRSQTVEYVDTALDIIRDPRNPPDVQAATLRLLGSLHGLEVVDDDPTLVTFRLDFEERGIRHRLTFKITSMGGLTEESVTILETDPVLGVPKGILTRRAVSSDVEIVAELP